MLSDSQLSDALDPDLGESEAVYAAAGATVESDASLNDPQSETTATSITLTLPSESVPEGQPLTLSARVVAADGTPIDGGIVVFLVAREHWSFLLPSHYPQAVAPGTGWDPSWLLGYAGVAADGSASITVSDLPPNGYLVNAVFVGRGAPVLRDGWFNAHSVVAPDAGETVDLIDVRIESRETSYRSSLVITDGRGFVIEDDKLTLLESLQANASNIPATGLHVEQDELSSYQSPPAYVSFAGEAVHVRAEARRDASNGVYYDYYIRPVEAEPIVPAQATRFTNSVTMGTVRVAAATALSVEQWIASTYTNPPEITVSIMDLAGKRLSHDEPRRIGRGAYTWATASLHVLVPNPGGGNPNGTVVDGGNVRPDHPVPTGLVSYFEGATLLATVPLDADGNAGFQFPVRSLSLGAHTIRVEYSGDANYRPATGQTSFTITHTPTRVELTPSKQIVQPGESFTLESMVWTGVPDTVTPSGDVRFYIGKALIATVPLGQTQARTFQLAAGQHKLRAVYSGDADCLPSETRTTVTVAGTATRVSVPTSEWDRDRDLTFKGRLEPVNGGKVDPLFNPTGMVRFYLDDRKIGAAAPGGRVRIDGKLKPGKYDLKVVYRGDARTLPSTTLYRLVVKKGRARLIARP